MKCFMTNQDCIFEKVIQETKARKKETKALFVISPFGYPYDNIYKSIIEECSKSANIVAGRADRAFQLGFVMCRKICKLIQEADHVMVDVTEDNANVYYELGLAWGFGKKITLVRDTQRANASAFNEAWNNLGSRVLSYEDLLPLETIAKSKQGGEKFTEILQRHLNVEKEYNMERHRKPAAYIKVKGICFCHQERLPDTKFYEREIEKSAKQVSVENKTAVWKMQSLPLDPANIVMSLPEDMASSKVWIVDVTHYEQRVDPTTYFVLGLAHSLGRETIPITNKARGNNISPFDVRALWQIYFDNLDTLREELTNILKVIDQSYATENQEYPLRFVWDQVLEPHANLEVFTCARGAETEEDRQGGRTNVDKWDYTSVAELTFFLAQKYNHARVHIEPPEEKVIVDLDTDARKDELTSRIQAKLQNTLHSVIVIGSPDVSDYAEVVLAKSYSVNPYRSQPCFQREEAKQTKCWDCIDPRNSKCIGKHGYLFYKNTLSSVNPRKHGAFFRMPPSKDKECVVWYGKKYECSHIEQGGRAHGETYGVLTVFKDSENFFGENRWIVVLSGYTGIGTYALTKLLTEGQDLHKALTEADIDLEHEGAQLLVAVQYESDAPTHQHDSRRYLNHKIMNARPFLTLQAEEGSEGQKNLAAPLARVSS